MGQHTYIIDVRTKEEYDAGHTAEAINFDFERIATGELPPIPKDATIKLYCRSGNRSELAKAILLEHGFTDVTNVGGYPQ